MRATSRFRRAFPLFILCCVIGLCLWSALPSRTTHAASPLPDKIVPDSALDEYGKAHRDALIAVIVVVLAVVTLASAGFARLRHGSTANLWIVSISFSFACAVGIGVMLSYVATKPSEPTPFDHIVQNSVDASSYVSAQMTVANPPEGASAVVIPTGVFIQSLEFSNTSDLFIKGYIWQRFDPTIPSWVTHGVLFPEAHALVTDVAYDRMDGDTHVIGWSFEATVREQFYYQQYPFDHQTIWLRLWPKDIGRNVILTPDFAAYQATDIDPLPGIEHDFVLENWQIATSYYSYRNNTYSVDFGLRNYVGQLEFPELYFNVDITRNILSTFIGYLITPTIVVILLFAVLLLATRDADQILMRGINTLSVLGYTAALFFIVILQHTGLRGTISEANLIYVEYYYFALYAAILFVSIDFIIYLSDHVPAIIAFRNNLLARLLFWPFLAGALLIATLVTFG